MLKVILTLIVVTGLGGLAFVRLSPSNPAKWHVDPLTAKKPATPNSFILHPDHAKFPAPVFEMSADALAEQFDGIALGSRGVSRLAGDLDELWITYVARTKWMGYPDYVSAKFIALDENLSTLAVFSRSRFGRGDLGFNRKRVLGWVAQISGK